MDKPYRATLPSIKGLYKTVWILHKIVLPSIVCTEISI